MSGARIALNVRSFAEMLAEPVAFAEQVQQRGRYRELVERLGPRVDSLLTDAPPHEVAGLLRADEGLSDREREVALQVLLMACVGERDR